ncbi:MAG: GNAT family N-acetyltransferase [Actinobacteria bacterium]|nr:GNAT family N-acetyltransferase [Actinomycetota bacterium]
MRVARSAAELDDLRPAWGEVAWEREEAEIDYLLARARLRDEIEAPFGLLTGEGGGIAGRVEVRRLPARIGYRTVVAPKLRILRVVDGGVVGRDAVAALHSVVHEFDAIAFPPLTLGSELELAARGLGGPLQRQPFAPVTPRRRLRLPATYEEFVASRSSNTRWRIHRDSRRVPEALGDHTIEVIRTPDGVDELFRDAERVAARTYQRAIGAGFADTPEQRELARLGLEHGWVRAYLLYARGEPVAFWVCSTYRGTLLIRQTGFDSAYAAHRVGVFLLLHVIEDAIADPALQVVDFGPGDAAYKQQFSSESGWEREVVVFAPTLRGIGANAVRTPVLGSARLARRLLDATELTDRVRSGWRARLRRSS